MALGCNYQSKNDVLYDRKLHEQIIRNKQSLYDTEESTIKTLKQDLEQLEKMKDYLQKSSM